MLTPSDKKNIKIFESLKENHKRVFKCRLIKKCRSALKDIEFLLLHYEELKLKVDRVIDIDQLTKLLELYEKLCLLQNV